MKAAFGVGRQQVKRLALCLGGLLGVSGAEIRPRQRIQKEWIGSIGGGDRVLRQTERGAGLKEVGPLNFEERVRVFVPFHRTRGRLICRLLQQS